MFNSQLLTINLFLNVLFVQERKKNLVIDESFFFRKILGEKSNRPNAREQVIVTIGTNKVNTELEK